MIRAGICSYNGSTQQTGLLVGRRLATLSRVLLRNKLVVDRRTYHTAWTIFSKFNPAAKTYHEGAEMAAFERLPKRVCNVSSDIHSHPLRHGVNFEHLSRRGGYLMRRRLS